MVIGSPTLILCRIQTILESYKTWVETIVGVHWVRAFFNFYSGLENELIYRDSGRAVYIAPSFCAMPLYAQYVKHSSFDGVIK